MFQFITFPERGIKVILHLGPSTEMDSFILWRLWRKVGSVHVVLQELVVTVK